MQTKIIWFLNAFCVVQKKNTFLLLNVQIQILEHISKYVSVFIIYNNCGLYFKFMVMPDFLNT